MGIPLTQQASNESRLSMSESVSEFFDAQEVLLSASSSENEVGSLEKDDGHWVKLALLLQTQIYCHFNFAPVSQQLMWAA